MASRNRVVWSEGLFIKPQHFQQQQRSLEGLIDTRLKGVSHYLYGFLTLELNNEFLSFGRIAISRASGVMPDGVAGPMTNCPHVIAFRRAACVTCTPATVIWPTWTWRAFHRACY